MEACIEKAEKSYKVVREVCRTYIILMLGTCQLDHTDKETFWKQIEEMRQLILRTYPVCKKVYAAEILPRVYRPKLL